MTKLLHRSGRTAWAIVTIAGLASGVGAEVSAPATAAGLLDHLREADSNGDGQITRAELLAYRAHQFDQLDRNRDGFITRSDVPALLAGRFEPRLQQMLARFDSNHDGRASRAEFVSGPTPGFDLADANHDGVVLPAELQAALNAAGDSHNRAGRGR